MIKKRKQRITRHLRVRKKISGKNGTPRLSIFRSNKFIYAQIIDDREGKTIISISDIKKSNAIKEGKLGRAKEIGKTLATQAIKKNIKKVVFDRGGYKYHGRVKAIAEGAREGGLIF